MDENVHLFILGYILKENTLLAEWLLGRFAGQITQPRPFFHKEVFGTAARIVAPRRSSNVCFTLWLLRFGFRQARRPLDLHLKLTLCLRQNYEAFFDAREDNAVYAFLGLTAPPGSKVRTQACDVSFSLNSIPAA